jgi:hypothetical protein
MTSLKRIAPLILALGVSPVFAGQVIEIRVADRALFSHSELIQKCNTSLNGRVTTSIKVRTGPQDAFIYSYDVRTNHYMFNKEMATRDDRMKRIQSESRHFSHISDNIEEALLPRNGEPYYIVRRNIKAKRSTGNMGSDAWLNIIQSTELPSLVIDCVTEQYLVAEGRFEHNLLVPVPSVKICPNQYFSMKVPDSVRHNDGTYTVYDIWPDQKRQFFILSESTIDEVPPVSSHDSAGKGKYSIRCS